MSRVVVLSYSPALLLKSCGRFYRPHGCTHNLSLTLPHLLPLSDYLPPVRSSRWPLMRQRWSNLLAVPGLSALHELNVRTYARLDGVPGVWFLSLDATQPLGVWAARTLFHLPYLHASMQLTHTSDGMLHATATRTHRDEPAATFAASWQPGAALPLAQPNTLAHFLTERYHLYTAGHTVRAGQHENSLWRGRLWHEPWALREATLTRWESTLVESHGLPTPAGPPLLHAADRLDVWVEELRRV